MKGMITCKVCGRDFALMAEEHYVARDVGKKGLLPTLSGEVESVEYDAFDCPHCGCQVVTQPRKLTMLYEDECPCDFGICDECNHSGETVDHDGCVNCAYEGTPEGGYPCNRCKSSYEDLWEKGEENDG